MSRQRTEVKVIQRCKDCGISVVGCIRCYDCRQIRIKKSLGQARTLFTWLASGISCWMFFKIIIVLTMIFSGEPVGTLDQLHLSGYYTIMLFTGWAALMLKR